MRNTMLTQPKVESFGQWLDARTSDGTSDDETPYLSDLYPTYKQQVDVCYLARAYGYGFDPYNAAACKDELGMRRELEAWMISSDVVDAWNVYYGISDLYEPWDDLEGEIERSWRFCDSDDESEIAALTPYDEAEMLGRRIHDSLPQSGCKPFSKKRRGTDRKPRYERRDGSPRGHQRDGASHQSVQVLTRTERTNVKHVLRNIRVGAVDPDAVNLTAQSKALSAVLMST